MEDVLNKNKNYTPENILEKDDTRESTIIDDTMVSNFDFSAIMDDRYDFSHIKRGYMAIIVNDSFKNGRKRKGSDVDMINLMGVANKLGLSPVTKKNVTKTQMMQFLLDLQMLDFSECDTFAFAISTHGVETPNPRKGGALDHALVCTDDELIYTSTITEMFSNGNCPSLCNKPKMFFIEASKKNIEEETVSLHCEIDQLERSRRLLYDKRFAQPHL
ncbi:hypothetical protein DPMN_025847 [Dreissena polymorpha]|uniref:Caspase family p20 domain-containing protein n=1 Tax=Dreissena polymorpha TaxID=45954 RepID=A0A9D4LSB9_DREPO|nr:hypothetical protein DPMN_025847 [Dreissena polymorpha]